MKDMPEWVTFPINAFDVVCGNINVSIPDGATMFRVWEDGDIEFYVGEDNMFDWISV